VDVKLGSKWLSSDNKEFVLLQEQDDTVWYAHQDSMYCCRKEAFLERFRLVENQ
jgi:hypothetical protein